MPDLHSFPKPPFSIGFAAVFDKPIFLAHVVAEEMPDAYKDVDLVSQITEEAKLAARVARLKPSLVIKG